MIVLNRKNNKKKGFTLLETIIAIAIIVVAITGPLGMSATGIHSATYSKNEMTAYYLAQEALELSRKLRDAEASRTDVGAPNFASTESVFGNCFDAGGSSVDCIAEPMSSIGEFIKSCETENCALLYHSDDSGQYVHDTINVSPGQTDFVPSIFSRRIRMTKPSDSLNRNREVEIEVEVTWKTGLLDRSISLRDIITCWEYTAPNIRCGPIY